MYLMRKYFSSQPTGSQTIEQEEDVEDENVANAEEVVSGPSDAKEGGFADAEEDGNQHELVVHDTSESPSGADEEKLQRQELEVEPEPDMEPTVKPPKARKSRAKSSRSSMKATDIGDEDFMGDGGVAGSGDDEMLGNEPIPSTPSIKRTRTSGKWKSLEEQVPEEEVEVHESPIFTAPRGGRLGTEDVYRLEEDEVLEEQRKVDGTYLTKKQVEYRFPHSPSVFDHSGPNRKVKVKIKKAKTSALQSVAETVPAAKPRASSASSRNTQLPSPRESDSQEAPTSAQESRNVEFPPIRPLLKTYPLEKFTSVDPQKQTLSPPRKEIPLSVRLTSAIRPPTKPMLPNDALTSSHPQVKTPSRIVPPKRISSSSIPRDGHAHPQPETPAAILPKSRRKSPSPDLAPTSAQPQRQISLEDEEASQVPRSSAKAMGRQKPRQDASEHEEVPEPARMSAKALGKRKASNLVSNSSKKQKRKKAATSADLMSFGFTESTTPSENGQHRSVSIENLGEAASQMFAARENDGMDLDGPEEDPAVQGFANEQELGTQMGEAESEPAAQNSADHEDGEMVTNGYGHVQSPPSLFLTRVQGRERAPTPRFTPINAKNNTLTPKQIARVEIRSAPRPTIVFVPEDTPEHEPTEAEPDTFLVPDGGESDFGPSQPVPQKNSRASRSSAAITEDGEEVEKPKSTKRSHKKNTPAKSPAKRPVTSIPASGSVTLTKAEMESIYTAVISWQEQKDLSDFEINELVAANVREAGDQRKMWAFIFGEVGDLPERRVRDTVRRKFTNCKRGPFTAEEDEELEWLFQQRADSWKWIGASMNRLAEDCRDRWRNVLMCSDNRKTCAWSLEEEVQLKDIVDDALVQIAKYKVLTRKDKDQFSENLINWKVISERMGLTRSRLQCQSKWKRLKKRFDEEGEDLVADNPNELATWRKQKAMVGARDLVTSEKLNMLYAIRDSGAGREGKIPWVSIQRDALGNLGKASTLKLAFHDMKEQVEDYRNKPFKQIVEELIDAYETSVPEEPPEFKFSKQSVREKKQRKPRKSKTVVEQDNGEGSSEPTGPAEKDNGEGQSEPISVPSNGNGERSNNSGNVSSSNSVDLPRKARGLSIRGREKQRMKLAMIEETERNDVASSMPRPRRKLKDKMKEHGQDLSQESEVRVERDESLTTAFESVKSGKRKAKKDPTSPKAKKPLIIPRRATRKSFLSKETVESGDEEDDVPSVAANVQEAAQEEIDDGMQMQLDNDHEAFTAPNDPAESSAHMDSSAESDANNEEEGDAHDLESRHVMPNPFLDVEAHEASDDEEDYQEDEEADDFVAPDEPLSEAERSQEDQEMAEADANADEEEDSFESRYDTESVDLDAPTPTLESDGLPYYDDNEGHHVDEDGDETGSVDLDSPTKVEFEEGMDIDPADIDADESSPEDENSGPSIASYELSIPHVDGNDISLDHPAYATSDEEDENHDHGLPNGVAASPVFKYGSQELPEKDSDDSSVEEDDRASQELSNGVAEVEDDAPSTPAASYSASDAESLNSDDENIVPRSQETFLSNEVNHEQALEEASDSDSDAVSSASDLEMPGYQPSHVHVQVTSYDDPSEEKPLIKQTAVELEFSSFDGDEDGDEEEFESSGYPALYLDASDNDDEDNKMEDREESVESDGSSDMSSIQP